MGQVNLDITTTLKGTLPRVPFVRLKKDILGASYELSLVLIGDTLATRLNQTYKHKDTPTNVLSFPLSSNEGEIFLNVRRAQRDAKRFGHTPREHVAFLFIHGCLHLKGYTHGPHMEAREEELLATMRRGRVSHTRAV